ncbi:hypothetical protein [Paraburkholderia sp.]|uniref:hypothetical protein n=1 Tax=Paraburkholderia sp. TaxID=1926495 RepID=UPI0039E4497A
MSAADKRSVHTDALATLGTIIGPSEARDAIHLAVEPVVAGVDLEPGDDVFLDKGEAFFRSSTGEPETVGIVDPFLRGKVRRGERFWLVVYPRQITSLRHVWTHPSFDAVPDLPAPVKLVTAIADDWGSVVAPAALEKPSFDMERAEAETRLKQFADEIGASLEELIERATDHAEAGDYWVEGDRFEGQSIPSTFWNDYETYTGRKVKADNRDNFFSCFC